jgi:DNA-binding transcriptional LysR family regulator
MADVELRELQPFSVLVDELHFGRTAERLGVTPSRVDQTARAWSAGRGGPPALRPGLLMVELLNAASVGRS